MDVKDKIKETMDSKRMKGFFDTRKKIAAVGAAAVILIGVAATAFLYKGNQNLQVLFPGISREENAEVFAVLQSRDVEVKRNDEGEVMVPESQIGDVMLDMSMLGYPKTALPFDIFTDNTGFTTTEFEKKQYLLLNLQDRIERTLKDMNGVKNAIVTLNVPDDSTYVWEETSSDSTGSVSLSFFPTFELSPDKVAAIKNLVANSVPRLLPENVTIINADTMEELISGDMGSGSLYGLNRLDFEARVEEKLENKIKNVLALGYKSNQIRVSATVVIDYDKMITEDLQYRPEANGQGIVKDFQEQGSGNGAGMGAGGIAGEENNTDIPTYGGAAAGGGNNGGNDYYRSVDYLVSHIKRQIEKDNVELQKATVAISVNDDNLTETKKQQLIQAASKAANIAPEDIVVTSFKQLENPEVSVPDTIPVQAGTKGIWNNRAVLYGIAGLIAVLLLLIVMLVRKSKKIAQEDEELFGFAGSDEEMGGDSAKQEPDRKEEAVKISLSEQIKKSQNPAEQVKAFAKTNPEIIASMISSWLKEAKK